MASVDENADGGVVTAVATENADEVTVDDDRFEVAGGNLKLKDGAILDFESDTSPIDVTITATAAGDDATHTVSVSINDVNDAPTITVAAMTTPDAMAAGVDPDLTVSEGSDGSIPGAVVAHIALSDQDMGDTHTLTVSDDRFETIQAFGQWWLKLKAGAELDHETEAEIMVTATVTDSGDPAMMASADVTVMVTDANDAPMISVADGTTPDNMMASSTVDENVMGALLGEITLSDQDEGDTHTLTVSDDRFEAKQDPEGGWWLKLKDDISLDHEAAATVTVTVTVTDDGDPAMSASTDVTMTVTDVNDAPVAEAEPKPVPGDAGSALGRGEGISFDLLPLFSDPDGDSLQYTMTGLPSGLRFVVERGTDGDGNPTVHGRIIGTVGAASDDSGRAHTATLTATDPDGLEASQPLTVVIDDGNDQITGVSLVDSDGNPAIAEVDENDNSGVVLGEIQVDDQDDPMHPNGMHRIDILIERSDVPNAEVVDNRFDVERVDGKYLLKLKEGQYLNHEPPGVTPSS